MTRTVLLSEPEAWLLAGILQAPGMENGRQNLRRLLLKIFSILNEFEQRRSRPFAPTALPIGLTEEECWLICHNVRPLLADGRAGRLAQSVLLNVSQLLLQFQDNAVVEPLGLSHSEPTTDRPIGLEDLDRLRRFLWESENGAADSTS